MEPVFISADVRLENGSFARRRMETYELSSDVVCRLDWEVAFDMACEKVGAMRVSDIEVSYEKD